MGPDSSVEVDTTNKLEDVINNLSPKTIAPYLEGITEREMYSKAQIFDTIYGIFMYFAHANLPEGTIIEHTLVRDYLVKKFNLEKRDATLLITAFYDETGIDYDKISGKKKFPIPSVDLLIKAHERFSPNAVILKARNNQYVLLETDDTDSGEVHPLKILYKRLKSIEFSEDSLQRYVDVPYHSWDHIDHLYAYLSHVIQSLPDVDSIDKASLISHLTDQNILPAEDAELFVVRFTKVAEFDASPRYGTMWYQLISQVKINKAYSAFRKQADRRDSID